MADDTELQRAPLQETWECHDCMWENTADTPICEACGTARGASFVEAIPWRGYDYDRYLQTHEIVTKQDPPGPPAVALCPGDFAVRGDGVDGCAGPRQAAAASGPSVEAVAQVNEQADARDSIEGLARAEAPETLAGALKSQAIVQAFERMAEAFETLAGAFDRITRDLQIPARVKRMVEGDVDDQVLDGSAHYSFECSVPFLDDYNGPGHAESYGLETSQQRVIACFLEDLERTFKSPIVNRMGSEASDYRSNLTEFQAEYRDEACLIDDFPLPTWRDAGLLEPWEADDQVFGEARKAIKGDPLNSKQSENGTDNLKGGVPRPASLDAASRSLLEVGSTLDEITRSLHAPDSQSPRGGSGGPTFKHFPAAETPPLVVQAPRDAARKIGDRGGPPREGARGVGAPRTAEQTCGEPQHEQEVPLHYDISLTDLDEIEDEYFPSDQSAPDELGADLKQLIRADQSSANVYRDTKVCSDALHRFSGAAKHASVRAKSLC